MGRRRIAFLVGLLALAGVATLVPSVAGGAGPIGTCQLAAGAGPFELGRRNLVVLHSYVNEPPLARIELQLHISANGEAEASGMVGITDGSSNTIMVAERYAQVSCADLDGDNLRGIVRVMVRLVQLGLATHTDPQPLGVRPGELFVAVITPEEEVDTSGSYLTTIEINSADGRTVVAGPTALVFFLGGIP